MKSIIVIPFLCHLACLVAGHGRLIKPAARNCMWRFGFPNPPQYTDNELNCGGFSTQWKRNDGKCGVCGDPWHMKNKRYEYPGKYCNGIIAKEYIQGEEIEVEVHLTSNHQGWFEFRIGDIGKPPVTQAKLKYLLPLVGDGTRYYVPRGSGNGKFKAMLKLPHDLTCDNCVLQWWYHCGNNWGCNSNGECGVGKNPRQETFVNCADVKIHPRGGPKPKPKPDPTEYPTKPMTAPRTRPPRTSRPKPPPSGKNCRAVGGWKGNKHFDEWCKDNCRMGNCPASVCKCS